MDDKQKSPVVWLSAEQVAQRLHRTPAALATWRNQEKGPPWVKVGGKTAPVYYPEDKLYDWMRRQPMFVPRDGNIEAAL